MIKDTDIFNPEVDVPEGRRVVGNIVTASAASNLLALVPSSQLLNRVSTQVNI
jgi:hypothetical protein